MQMWKVGKEIVTNKESHKNEIVNDTLHVKWEAESARLFQFLEFEFQIFSNNAEMHEVKVLMFQLLGLGLALAAKRHLLTQQAEVGVVAKQTQHDQVGIETVQAVATVRVVPRLCLGLTDVLHDFVLSLSGDFVTRQYDFHALPVYVLGDLFVDEVLELLRELRHKCSARRDAVAVERFLGRHFYAFADGLLPSLFSIESGSETSRTLLVHLGARSDTIDGHEKELLGLDLAKQMLDVVEDGDEHLVFGLARRDAIGIVVGAVVDNSVHIKLWLSAVRIECDTRVLT
jgi:hypothetical protein